MHSYCTNQLMILFFSPATAFPPSINLSIRAQLQGSPNISAGKRTRGEVGGVGGCGGALSALGGTDCD